jgi:hypothetical protein
MILNKLPALDKGYVALIDSSLSGKVLSALEEEHFNGKINRDLLGSAQMTLQVRCPIFFQLFLQQFNVKVINTIEKDIQCYTPDVSEISTGDASVDDDISKHMKATIEALCITSKAFQKDGLDKFMSHNLMPISVYNTVIITASLSEWIRVVSSKKTLPYPIEVYTDHIKDILEAEWPKLSTYIRGK